MKKASVVLAGACLVLAGCSHSVSPSPTTAASSAAAPTPAASASSYWDGDGPEAPASHTPLPTGAAVDSSASGVAVVFMTLFARPTVDQVTWWRDISGYFTPQGAIDYQGTQPYRIPVRKVTGKGRLISTDSPQLAKVQVPTDIGIYLVVLSRSTDDPSWKVARIMPPEIEAGD